jgi:hypothetical protein
MMKEFIISQIEDTKKSPPVSRGRFIVQPYVVVKKVGRTALPTLPGFFSQEGGQNNIAHPTWLAQ